MMWAVEHLVLVAVAGKSMQYGFDGAKAQVPIPTETYRCWQELRNEGRVRNVTPFAEIVPLLSIDGQFVEVRRLTLILLGNDTDADPLLEHAKAPLREYAAEYCSRAFPGADVEVQWRSLGGYTVDNTGPDTSAVRALIMDLAAGIDSEFAGGEGTTIAANAIAGANIGVDALMFAADELGWQAWYSADNRVRFVQRDLNRSALAHQWGIARHLVDRFESARDFTRPAVREMLGRAESHGVLTFVAPDPEANGGHAVRMSGLGMALLRRHSGRGRTVYSARHRMLWRRGDAESQRWATRLQALLEGGPDGHPPGWARSDLFGSNQVSELVGHTESHCEAVDRNVASLTGPLLDAIGASGEPLLTPEDVFHLAVAAWLHDWGHSGAAFSTNRVLANIREASDIREAHGVLSAERIRDLLSQSGLTRDEAVVPALIAAHHQGWTSVDRQDPTLRDCLLELSDQPWSLTAQLGDAVRRGELSRDAASRIPLLIACFRVCDAADVGIHRAFYAHVVADRIRDEIMLYARRKGGDDLQVWLSYLRQAVDGHLDQVVDEGQPDPNPTQFGVNLGTAVKLAKDDETVEDILVWARHCLKQVSYFAHHRYVVGVHLGVQRSTGAFHVVPRVAPIDEEHAADALLAVCEDIHRELGDSVTPGVGGGFASKRVDERKAVVKDILHRAGIVIDYAEFA